MNKLSTALAVVFVSVISFAQSIYLPDTSFHIDSSSIDKTTIPGLLSRVTALENNTSGGDTSQYICLWDTNNMTSGAVNWVPTNNLPSNDIRLYTVVDNLANYCVGIRDGWEPAQDTKLSFYIIRSGDNNFTVQLGNTQLASSFSSNERRIIECQWLASKQAWLVSQTPLLYFPGAYGSDGAEITDFSMLDSSTFLPVVDASGLGLPNYYFQFESGDSPTYTTTTFDVANTGTESGTDSVVNFTGIRINRGKDANEKVIGTYAMRLAPINSTAAYAYNTTAFPSPITALEFQYAIYGTDTCQFFEVSTSSDGTNWTALTNLTSVASQTFQTYHNESLPADTYYVRFDSTSTVSGNTRRMDVDEIKIWLSLE